MTTQQRRIISFICREIWTTADAVAVLRKCDGGFGVVLPGSPWPLREYRYVAQVGPEQHVVRETHEVQNE